MRENLRHILSALWKFLNSRTSRHQGKSLFDPTGTGYQNCRFIIFTLKLRLKFHFVLEKFIETRILVKQTSNWEQEVHKAFWSYNFQKMPANLQSLQKTSTENRMWQKEHALEVQEAFKLSESLNSSQWGTKIKLVHKTTDQFTLFSFVTEYTPLIMYFNLKMSLSYGNCTQFPQHKTSLIIMSAMQTPEFCQSQTKT